MAKLFDPDHELNPDVYHVADAKPTKENPVSEPETPKDTPKPPAPKATEMENTTKTPDLKEGVDKPPEFHQEPGTPKADQG